MKTKRFDLKMMEFGISWLSVFIYITFLVMFLDLVGIEPDLFLKKILDKTFPIQPLNIWFWINLIGLFIFGYVIPINIKEGVYNILNKKKIKFQAKPFYYDDKRRIA